MFKNNISSIFDKISLLDFKALFSNLLQHEKNKVVVSFVNPYSSTILLQQHDYNYLLDGIDYLFVDGELQVKIANILFKKKIRRYSFDFTSIADFVFKCCVDNELTIGLIGGSENEIQNFIDIIKRKYPKIKIPQYRSGFFDSDDLLFKYLKCLDVDVLIIGMGTPLQERVSLIAKKYSIRSKIIITCGGFISQTSKKEDYYHPFIKKTGLRWLQRAWMEPHYRSRLIVQYPQFIITCFKVYLTNFKKN